MIVSNRCGHYRDFGLRYHSHCQIFQVASISRSWSPPFQVFIDHDIPKGKTHTLLVSVQDYHVYFFFLTPLDTGLLAQLQVQLKRKPIPQSSSFYPAQGI